MPKLTRRQSALAWNSQAPLEMDKVVPAKRVVTTSNKEWKLQAMCVHALRERMTIDKDLRYEVNLIEGARSPARANVLKMMGSQKGPNDLTLYRRYKNANAVTEYKTHRIEFKLPGKQLTPEQREWMDWWSMCGVPCSRVDNLQEFLRILDNF